LNAGANVSAESTKLGPPLVIAVNRGLKFCVRILLDAAGVNVNQIPTSHNWLPALHTAAREGHSEITEMLMNAGADVNMAVGWDCPTPLHVAARHVHPTIVQKLLNAGAEVDGGTSCLTAITRTPLQWALEGKNERFDVQEETVLALLQAGANLNASGGFGPPLVLAVERRRKTLVQFLLKVPGVDVNQRPTSGGCLPPLHTAVRSGDSEMIEMLVNAGADVNMIFGVWGTPLDVAIICQCQDDIVRILRDPVGRQS
jgi:ankyrin repeat protein